MKVVTHKYYTSNTNNTTNTSNTGNTNNTNNITNTSNTTAEQPFLSSSSISICIVSEYESIQCQDEDDKSLLDHLSAE